mgnify:CR=1 FL=1
MLDALLQAGATLAGKVLTDAAEVGTWGAPTFEVWVARKDFAEKHPELLSKFAQVSLDAFADYAANKDSWTADSEPVQKIAKLTGADPKDVPELLAGSAFPDAKQQAELLSGLGAHTPVAIVQHASLPHQREAFCTLGDLARTVREQGMGSPAVMVVGDVTAGVAQLARSGEGADAGTAFAGVRHVA